MIPITTVENYKELLDALLPVVTIEMHFKQDDTICVRMMDASNCILLDVKYKSEVQHPISWKFDLNVPRSIKSKSVDVIMVNDMLYFRSGNLTYKIEHIIDPRAKTVDNTQKFETFPISISKEVLTDLNNIVNQNTKFYFEVNNNILNVYDEEHIVDANFNVECTEHKKTLISGELLLDIIKPFKTYDTCIFEIGDFVPLIVKYHNDYLDTEYWIAPILDNNN